MSTNRNKTVELSGRWRTRLSKAMKNHERRPTFMSELDGIISENLSKDHRLQEQQLALWKDRPRLAKEEIPDEIFQILQKQHSEEDNTAP